MNFSIREAREEDAGALADLCTQLGYPITEEGTISNLKNLFKKGDEKIFVAIDKNKIVGWTGVAFRTYLVSGPNCEINGLVVDINYHRKGIGKQLIEEAKRWGKEQGVRLMRVRCNTKRKEAHMFYAQLGFKEVKEQKNFEIEL
ncbi:MAG: GNAT family N-acetyltransferase [Bacteroidota bacterium]